MKLRNFSIVLSTLATIANAATWKFNVVNIAGPEYDMGVKYNNKVTKMKSDIFPLYTTTIQSGSGNKYNYVILDKSGNVVEEESISREYYDSVGSINEVYNRVTKTVNVPSLPKIYEPLYTESDSYHDYPKNEIFTLYAKCEESNYKNLKYIPLNGYDKNLGTANCTLNIITPTTAETRAATLQLVGFNSRYFKKLSWKFKLDKKFLGRKTIKVRALASDPTMMRDKLSSELYRAVGVPSYSGTYARLMINNDIWGLYSIVDTIGGKWIASTIHGNEDARVGFNYKMYSSVPNGPFASLRYLGDDPDKYLYSGSYEVDEIDKDDTQATNDFYRLSQFTKMFENWTKTYANDQSDAAITALEQFFNLESLLRQLVIEALTLAYDNFWAQTGNFALYYNPEREQYQIIPYDFDGTFYGSNGSPYYASNYISDCISWADNTAPDKYFVSNLFKHQQVKDRYKQIMDKTVKNLFNVDSVSPFIDSVSQLIRDDVKWNFELIDKLDNNIQGHTNHFTITEFDGNTNYKMVDYNPTKNYNDAHYGIKQWIKTRGDYCAAYSDGASVGEVVPTQKPIKNSATVEKVKTNKPVATTTTTTTTKPRKTTTTTTKPRRTTTTRRSYSYKSTTTTTRVRITKKVTVKKVVTVTKYNVKN